MIDLTSVINTAFHGIAYGMILYLISVGLSVTMGLMGIVNLAHGVFAMAGGYLMLSAMNGFGISFPAAVLLAFVVVALASVLIERLLYSRVYAASELDQVLLTFGLIFVAIAVARMVFGTALQPVNLPDYLRGQIAVFGHQLPTYRALLIVISAVIVAGLWFGLERTLWGAMVRAAVDDRTMAQSVGVNTNLLFTLTFALGSGLAGLGGALGSEIIAIEPAYPLVNLVYFLIVVAIGGLGSLRGSFVAALLIGISDTAFKYWAPEIGAFVIFATTIVILLWRPQGLLGRGT